MLILWPFFLRDETLIANSAPASEKDREDARKAEFIEKMFCFPLQAGDDCLRTELQVRSELDSTRPFARRVCTS